MNDTCGPMSERPLAIFDHGTQSWKMYGVISLWGDSPSLENLPPSGMTRNGALFAQPMLAHRTLGNESSLWPTPTIHGENTKTRLEAHKRRLAAGMPYSSRLTQAIAIRFPQDNGYLNPVWVERLMGFPTGWTDLQG